jgi:hypothetical protein
MLKSAPKAMPASLPAANSRKTGPPACAFGHAVMLFCGAAIRHGWNTAAHPGEIDFCFAAACARKRAVDSSSCVANNGVACLVPVPHSWKQTQRDDPIICNTTQGPIIVIPRHWSRLNHTKCDRNTRHGHASQIATKHLQCVAA